MRFDLSRNLTKEPIKRLSRLPRCATVDYVECEKQVPVCLPGATSSTGYSRALNWLFPTVRCHGTATVSGTDDLVVHLVPVVVIGYKSHCEDTAWETHYSRFRSTFPGNAWRSASRCMRPRSTRHSLRNGSPLCRCMPTSPRRTPHSTIQPRRRRSQKWLLISRKRHQIVRI
jgi:hypothetical protein